MSNFVTLFFFLFIVTSVTDKNGNVLNPSKTKIVAKKLGANGEPIDDASESSSCTCKKAVDASGNPACQPTNVDSEKCKIELLQESTCQNSAGTLKLAELTAEEIKVAKEKIDIDEATEDISYGGTLRLQDVNGNVDTLTMDLALALPEDMCGKNINYPNGKPLGFGGGHGDNKIYALLTDADGNSTWVEGIIKDGKVILKDVTVKLPVKISVFRATDKDTNNVSGMTGSTGAGGY